MESLQTSPHDELLGAERPRIELRPTDIVDSDGDIAADLMEAAGKSLEQWQRDGIDLMLSIRPDGKWACYQYAEWVARQQGKGVLGEARVVYGLLLGGEAGEGEDITWSAHKYDTSLQAFRRIRSVFRGLGESHRKASEETIDIDGITVKVWNSNSERGFERLDSGKRILFFARSKGGLRGFSPDVNVIDEAFAYTSEQQDAIAPTLIAKRNAQTIFLSSPPLSGDEGEVMYSLRKRAEIGAPRLGYRDWGLDGYLDDIDRVDIEDHRLWAQACPGLNRGRVSLETIQALCPPNGELTRKGFGREVLGLWPKQIIGGGAIDMGAWNGLMLDRESRREGDVAIAVDIAPERDYAAIGLYGLRKDGQLGHVQIIDYRPGTDWIIPRVVEWRESLDPIAVAMGKATFDSLGSDLQKRGIKPSDDKDAPRRGDLAVASWSEMSAATGQLLDAARQATFRHAGQPELDASVAGAKTKLNADSLVWARKDAAADTSPLVAITLARWAYESRAHLVRKRNYNLLDSVF